jgi:exopolysaccharide biosynthesis polyprenyl glycosylphosphotransferase
VLTAAPPHAAGRGAVSPNALALALAAADLLGVALCFNLSQWLLDRELSADLMLNWKLVLLGCYTFLAHYLLDLYTFDSQLSQLGMLERSLIGMFAIGAATALTVYVGGPGFIGGFVGRGVLALGLALLWVWSLSVRYAANAWYQTRASLVQWLVLARDDGVEPLIAQFRSRYRREGLLFLTRGPVAPAVPDSQTRVLGRWTELPEVAARHEVAGVVLACGDDLPQGVLDELLRMRLRGTRIHRLSDFYERYLFRLPVFNLDKNWVVLAHGFDLIHNPVGLRLKRYLDVAAALALLLLLAPLLLGLSVLLLATQGRPVLFSQRRVGEQGRPFTLYKLRTMRRDAEAQGPRYASRRDPRVTAAGAVLRRFRLDELPQLWNVLTGDMSFIGPRPERPEFTTDLQQRIPYYHLRHIVRPGLTGWAQVMYGYGDSADDAAQKLQYDLFYIKNYSLSLDLAIAVRSLKVILFGGGR